MQGTIVTTDTPIETAAASEHPLHTLSVLVNNKPGVLARVAQVDEDPTLEAVDLGALAQGFRAVLERWQSEMASHGEPDENLVPAGAFIMVDAEPTPSVEPVVAPEPTPSTASAEEGGVPLLVEADSTGTLP